MNSKLSMECKKRNIDIMDKISVTGLGKKGVHPNNLGKEQIAGNFLKFTPGV